MDLAQELDVAQLLFQRVVPKSGMKSPLSRGFSSQETKGSIPEMDLKRICCACLGLLRQT
jgi:hypothetical protein